MFTLSLCGVSINFENRCVFWEILEIHSCTTEDKLVIFIEIRPLIESVIKGFSLNPFVPGMSESATLYFKKIMVLEQ